jgi:raffinose/stachyose/melibiose transport system substrate-binding protein
VTLRLFATTNVQIAQDILDKNFERVYPNIHIEATYATSPNPYAQTLLTQFQAGNAPDIIYAQPGQPEASGAWNLAASGYLLDLKGSPWLKRVPPSLKSLITYKGKVVSWPGFIGVQGIVYNVDLFKQLGLTQPSTFADVIALCRKITAAGKIPFANGWGGTSAATTGSVWGLVRTAEDVYSLDPKWDAKRSKKQVTFAGTAGWRRVFQDALDMKNAGCFEPGAEGTSVAQANAMLAQGQAVMSVLAGAQIPAILQLKPDFHYAMMNFPAQKKADTVVATGASIAYSINARTEHPAEAKTFINFMGRAKQNSLFAKIGNGLAPWDAIKGIVPSWMAPMAAAYKAGKVIVNPRNAYPNPAFYGAAFDPAMVGILTGQKSVDDAVADLDKAWFPPGG